MNECNKIFSKTTSRRKWRRDYNDRPGVKKKRSIYHKVFVKKWHKEQMANNIKYRLARLLRKRLWRAMQGKYKTGSAVRDLGCSLEELKIFLEKKFKPGMTWSNYGTWHIDHIIPLATFDLKNKQQLLVALNFSNLQPLWATENLIKNKY
jgi:hypothetical protein